MYIAIVVNQKMYTCCLRFCLELECVKSTEIPTSFFFQAMVAPLLARSNLLITRDIEWANLMLGFEQVRLWLY